MKPLLTAITTSIHTAVSTCPETERGSVDTVVLAVSALAHHEKHANVTIAKHFSPILPSLVSIPPTTCSDALEV